MREPTDRYFQEVGAFPVPTSEEATANFRRYAQLRAQYEVAATAFVKDRLRSQISVLCGKIAQGYLRYVIREARKRTRDNNLLGDLISAGNEGLLCAIQKFDPERGNQFLTFAFYWVRVKMNTVLQHLGGVHVSVHRKRKEAEAGLPISKPTFVPMEDVEIAADEDAQHLDVMRDARALRYLNAAELSLRERLVVVYVLGLRGPALSPEAITRVFYTLDRSLLTPSDVERLYEQGMQRLRDWVTLCGEASIREELSEDPSLFG